MGTPPRRDAKVSTPRRRELHVEAGGGARMVRNWCVLAISSKMSTARRRELEFQNMHRAQAGAPFCRPEMVLMTTYVSEMSTPLRREHSFQSKWAPRAGERPESAPQEGRRCSRCGGAHPTGLSWDPPDVGAA